MMKRNLMKSVVLGSQNPLIAQKLNLLNHLKNPENVVKISTKTAVVPGPLPIKDMIMTGIIMLFSLSGIFPTKL